MHKKRLLSIVILFCTLPVCAQSLDDIVLDIYNAVAEFSETDFEQLQSDLYSIHEHPIDLNHTSDEELSQLYFLSSQQIDDILVYADKHPFESLYELRLISSLADYEIRDLLPFVQIINHKSEIKNGVIYPREVFAHAQHELITRIDARNIEGYKGDPVYAQLRYKFNYQNKITFGAQLRRPAGGGASDLQYGAYLQLRDLGHLHSLVAGNYQASFGQGLVFAPAFHSGKSIYVTSVGQQRDGLRYYSSVDGNGLHGVGATLRWKWGKATRLDVSGLYSMQRANDSTWHHVIGANMTVRHKQLEVQLTAAESIWSDSIRPYNNAAYNQHYFRGYSQTVIGASARYNFGIADVLGEIATSENFEITELRNNVITRPHWGIGTIIGSRIYPTDGVSLIALYRYYSPHFDNALGYAFSETSRIGDENGGYLGFDITRLRNWRFSGYVDVFYFSGVKYGIPQSGSIGYDVACEMKYGRNYGITSLRNNEWWTALRLRARKKGTTSTYSARAQFDWQSGPWSLRTTGEANLADKREAINGEASNGAALNYGLTVYQDVSFDCTPYTIHHIPLSIRLRLQGFDCRNWDNRIYAYEHDVLYAFSIPATYGLGGRAYVCLKWQIIKQLALYLKVSETVYQKNWAAEHDKSVTRTDVHVLLRAQF